MKTYRQRREEQKRITWKQILIDHDQNMLDFKQLSKKYGYKTSYLMRKIWELRRDAKNE